MRRVAMRIAWVVGLTLVITLARAQYALPTDMTGNWKVLIAQQGVVSDLTTAPEGKDDKTCVKLTFLFTGKQQEFLLASAPVPEPLTDDYQAVRITYRTAFPEGMQGPVVVVNEKGGANYAVEARLPLAQDWKTFYLPLSLFKVADWAKDDNGKLDKGEVTEFRLGLEGQLENPGQGTLWVNDVTFVKEIPAGNAYPPRDFVLMAEKDLGAELLHPAEGPQGEPVIRLNVPFAAGKDVHAFALTRLNGAVETAGKKSLRLTYKTQLPPKLNAAMLILGEQNGASYVALVPASAEWRVQDIPLSLLIQGEWAEDANNHFDPDQVVSFAFGTGGTSKTGDAQATVWLKEFEFVE